MKKLQKPLFLIAVVMGLALISIKVAMAGNQYNWGTSTGGSWSTPDDTAVMKNQVLQIGANATPSVVASTNVTIIGTLTVTGAQTNLSSMTVNGSITIPPTFGLTLAQLSALTPTTTGQITTCTNCTVTLLVIATGTTTGGQWAGVFSSTGGIPSQLK